MADPHKTTSKGSDKFVLGWEDPTSKAIQSLGFCGASIETSEEGDEKTADCDGKRQARAYINREQAATLTGMVLRGATIPVKAQMVSLNIDFLDEDYARIFPGSSKSDQWQVISRSVSQPHDDYRTVTLELRRSPTLQ